MNKTFWWIIRILICLFFIVLLFLQPKPEIPNLVDNGFNFDENICLGWNEYRFTTDYERWLEDYKYEKEWCWGCSRKEIITNVPYKFLKESQISKYCYGVNYLSEGVLMCRYECTNWLNNTNELESYCRETKNGEFCNCTEYEKQWFIFNDYYYYDGWGYNEFKSEEFVYPNLTIKEVLKEFFDKYGNFKKCEYQTDYNEYCDVVYDIEKEMNIEKCEITTHTYEINRPCITLDGNISLSDLNEEFDKVDVLGREGDYYIYDHKWMEKKEVCINAIPKEELL